MLELKGVAFRYPGSAFPALDDVSLALAPGETLAIVGMSGSGKTSLLKVMAGLLQPQAGTVWYGGAPLNAPHPDISVVFQNHGLLPWKTAKENILLPLRIKKEKISMDAVLPVAERLGIAGCMASYPGQLSGGEKQRVALARALVCNARVLLMDEPFSALDVVNREALQSLMLRLFREKGLAAVIVTHDIGQALLMGDRVAIFRPGGGGIARLLDNGGHAQDGYAQSETYLRRMLETERALKGGGV